MRKFFLLSLLLFVLSAKNYAQTDSSKSNDAKDSAEMMKDLMDILSSSEKPSSYFVAGIGIGNRLFNVRNNVLNTKQSTLNKLVYSPSVGYYHKNGLSFSAAVNLLNDSISGFGINQYSISPGYQLPDNDNIDFSIIYTHYFIGDKFSPYSSPLQNDFYSSLTYKKKWIQPGIALGYSTGEYGDLKRKAALYDSALNTISAFSFIISASHEFLWNGIFNKKDGFIFSPTLMLNMAESKIAIHHNTNATNLLNFLNKRGRLPKFKNTPFQAESIGLNLELNYIYNKLTITPQAYFDYYLPETTDNRFTNVFTLNISYSL